MSPYDKAADLNAMFRYADGRGQADQRAVDRLGVKIETYQSDNVVLKTITGLPIACTGATCVAYLKSCSSDGLSCDVEWGAIPAVGSKDVGVATHAFSIKATSDASLGDAESALFVEITTGGTTIHVPMTSMIVRSSATYSPPCDTTRVGSDCVNLFVGRLAPTARKPANLPATDAAPMAPSS